MIHFRLSAKSIPLAFLFVTLLAYGLLIPWTGFYWDDWPFAWIAHFLGPAEFFPAFAPFRPFLGPIFFLTTSLLPENPLVWQAFGVLVRFLTGLAAWWSLDQIWPNYKRQTLTAALLFLVFPGYSQQWVAFTHVNQEFIPLIFYVFSFGVTAAALRRQSRFLALTALALTLQVCGLFPTEYFFGLEPLRFLFIWAVLAETTAGFRARTRLAFERWLPYLLVWLANAAWLAYYYTYGAYASYEVTAARSSPALSSFFLDMGDALLKAGFYIWGQVLALTAQSLSAPSTWLTLGLIVASFLLLAFYFLRLDLPTSSSPNASWAKQALLLGLLGILLGRLPSWAAGLPLTLQSSYDRFMVSMMIGGSLFAAGLVELLCGKSRARVYAISLIVALGIGQQFFNANIFRRDWSRQQEIYWQFAWRIPALQPGTLLLTHQMPLDYETDLSMTAPLNWIYAPDFTPPELPYALLYTEKRLGGVILPELKPDAPVTVVYRTVTFHGSTSQAVVIYVPATGCLKVMDPIYSNSETFSKLSGYLNGAIFLSDPSRIRTDAPAPVLPAALFGKEPLHTWCYYYEKIELARQVNDWNAAAALGLEAFDKGYRPEDPYEWLPLIEGYARSGDLQGAAERSRQALGENPELRKGLCQLWGRVKASAEGQAEAEAWAASLLTNFACTP